MKKIIRCMLTTILILIMAMGVSATNVSSDIPNGIYYIGTKEGNRVDIKSVSMSNGAEAQVWKKANNDNQAFILTRLEDGTYKITAYHSGLSLEVSNGSKSNGGRVQQWEFLEDYNCKRWYIYECGNGWYKIVNKNSGKCLDIKGGKDKSGTVIQQYKDNGTNAQRFSLTKLEYSPQNYNRYKVGDVIYVTGKYYTSSDGGGNYGQSPQKYVIEQTAYGSKYPYAIRPVNGKYIYGWINESSMSLPDYTEEILYGVLPELQMLISAFDHFVITDALIEFYDTFKTNGTLDIKNKNRWNELFSIPYPESEKFIFLDMIVTADQLGNILYGWFGTLLGINDVMLYWGGGFAHQKNITGKSFSQTVALDRLYDPRKYYGDTAEDHFDVARGIALAGYVDEYVILMRLEQEGKWIQAGGKLLSVLKTTQVTIESLLESIYLLSI